MDIPAVNPTQAFDFLFLNRIDKMINEDVEGNTEKYFKNFDYCLKLAMSYLSTKSRAGLEADRRALEEAIKKISEDTNLNSESKRINTAKLRQLFADTHNFYIFGCLSRVGIQRLREDGVIDFDQLSIDQIAAIIRGGSGLPANVKRVVGTEVKEDGAIPKQ